MAYHSKALIYVKGRPVQTDGLVIFLKGLSEIRPLCGDINPQYATALTYTKEAAYGEKTVLRIKRDWFKAYNDWDDVVESISAYCKDQGLAFLYARFGENAEDVDVRCSEDGPQIGIERSFTIPEEYAGLFND